LIVKPLSNGHGRRLVRANDQAYLATKEKKGFITLTPDHVVAWVQSLGLAPAAEVIVGTGDALVSETDHCVVAAVASNARMFSSVQIS
jgi:hypothetical protein